MKKDYNIYIIRIASILFIYGAVTHWLIIFGILTEVAPLILTIYFHSLAILNPITAYGLWKLKSFGKNLGMFIAITQLISHGWMLIFYPFENWRILDIIFAVFYMIYFSKEKIKKLFN